VALVAAAVLALVWLRTRPVRFPAPRQAAETAAGPGFDDFVGAAACGECHAEQYEQWRGSTHGRAGGLPSRVRLIAPFDGTPIRFADAMVIPRVSPDGRYEFVVREDGREPQLFPVVGVIGGGHMVGGGTQGFVSLFLDGTVRFLPFDFIREEGVWFCNTNSRTDRGWIPITPEVSLVECADWPPVRVLGTDEQYANCQECHGSQIQLRFDPGENRFNTRLKSLAINCESCHGPGREHVARAREGRITDAEDIGIRSLATLSKDQSLEVCFQCHALKDALEPGYLPGKPLQDHYSLAFPVLGDQPLFPDGRVRTFAYQGDHRYSDCYLSGSMTCTDCHDPHSQDYRDIWGRQLAGRFDDGQCLDCHASKAARPEQHTRHPPESAGSRCVACHMPYLQHPELGRELRFARSDHTISIPRPAYDDRLGIEGACVQCHADRSVDALEAQTREWYGELKPHKPIIMALDRVREFTNLDSAAAALLDPDQRHPMAQVAALGQFVERFLRPDMPELNESIEVPLRALAGNDDIDVRALALAALHLARGKNRGTRAFLARALRSLGPEESKIRARWATALGTFGDRYAAVGDWRSAVVVYRKALEIRPGHPGILRNVGLAQISGGDYASAAASLRASLAADRSQPYAWLDLGLALERQGDYPGADVAYRRTIALRPDEALGHFNLGNSSVRRGDLGEATEHYEAAAYFDPTLTRAHLYLARAYQESGDLDRALAAARRAARLAPDDAGARRLVRQLEAAPGRR
jgi:tetratricopeptide (TPR) repeat protein